MLSVSRQCRLLAVSRSSASRQKQVSNVYSAATLTVELFDRGNMEGNSLTEGPITQYILENFAEPNNIDFQWKVLPRGEEESGLTLWMAAGDAPDLSFTYSWPVRCR